MAQIRYDTKEIMKAYGGYESDTPKCMDVSEDDDDGFQVADPEEAVEVLRRRLQDRNDA